MTRHRVEIEVGLFGLIERRARIMGIPVTAIVQEAVTIWLQTIVNRNRSPSTLQRVYFPAPYTIAGRRKAWLARQENGKTELEGRGN